MSRKRKHDGYNPENERFMAVYGPPEIMGISSISSAEHDTETISEEYNPADDIPVPAYGPPPDSRRAERFRRRNKKLY